MQTTVHARTENVAPTQLNIRESLVEGSDQKVLDLGLAVFERAHPRVRVVGFGREQVDLGLYAVQTCGVVPYGRRHFSLVSPEGVDGGQYGAIVGLVRFQSGNPRFELLQRGHRPILTGRSELMPVDDAGLTDGAAAGLEGHPIAAAESARRTRHSAESGAR